MWPRWNPDGGHELFYVGPPGIMTVAVDTETTFRWDPPELLFDPAGYGVPATVGDNRRIDISLDGKRFLMFKVDTPAVPNPTLVQNWFDELQRLVPSP